MYGIEFPAAVDNLNLSWTKFFTKLNPLRTDELTTDDKFFMSLLDDDDLPLNSRNEIEFYFLCSMVRKKSNVRAASLTVKQSTQSKKIRALGQQ